MAICAPHPQEAIGGVANPRWQNFVPEHGIDHGALPIARPRMKQQSSHEQSLGYATVVPSLGLQRLVLCHVDGTQATLKGELCIYENGQTNSSQPEPVLCSSLQTNLQAASTEQELVQRHVSQSSITH